VLGEFAPDEGTGPAIWLRCVIDRTVEVPGLPDEAVPVLYLPKVGRQQLRAGEECPRELRPLVELMYRGALWLQRGGHDWTVTAFLTSPQGLGLDLARDEETLSALPRALPEVAATPLQQLRGRRLEADDFDGTSEAAFALIHPDDLPALRAETAAALRGEGADHSLEHRVVRPDGTVRWVHSRGLVLRDRDGAPTALVGIALDITDRRTVESELSKRLAQQSEVGSLSQFALGGEGIDAVVERAVSVLAGALDVPLVGLFDRVRDDGALLLRSGVGWAPGLVGAARIPVRPGSPTARLLEDGPPVGFVDADGPTGEDIPVLLREHGVRSGMWAQIPGRDRPSGVLLACGRDPHRFSTDDLTVLRAVANIVGGARVRHAAEEQLVHAQKMEAIGRLAGGIAHDFNNLLTVMLGFSEMLEPAVADRAEAAADLRELRSAATRASGLVDQLLTFSRGRPSGDGTCVAEEVLAELAPLLRRLLDEDIELALTLDDHRSVVPLDAVRLEQVVMNLVLNARDALSEGGRIDIAVDAVEVSVAAGEALDLEPGGYVRVTVADSGTGMDEATSSRAFEPFFTTKGGRRGSGLGLSTVYGIARAAGGDVGITSSQGVGTTVTVHLPTITSRAGERAPAPGERAAEVLRGGALRILLVEDQAAVRRLVREVLTRFGHEVLEASNGVEALAVAERAGTIDLLLTDIVMPQMDGAELARRLRRRAPGLAVLYMSGYADEALRGLEEGATFLPKPFLAEELTAAVARAVRAGREDAPQVT
jgi:signal transduction histidine kinase/ActR/RegA family two-component response regulator